MFDWTEGKGGILELLEIRIQIQHVSLVKGSHAEGRLVLNIKLLCKVSILNQVWELLQLTNGSVLLIWNHLAKKPKRLFFHESC